MVCMKPVRVLISFITSKSLRQQCLQGFGGKTCIIGPLIRLDSSSLGQGPGWPVVNRVMKLLLNMGNYVSQ